MALTTVTLKLTEAERDLMERLREVKKPGSKGWRAEKYESNSDVLRQGLLALGRLHKLIDEEKKETLTDQRGWRGHRPRRGPRFVRRVSAS